MLADVAGASKTPLTKHSLPINSRHMDDHTHIVSNSQLRLLSGKKTASAVRRWASVQGIQVIEGASGPWTTIEAVNSALGITLKSANDKFYSVDLL
jgi:hypothetical protein